jgi:hypothetical protein
LIILRGSASAVSHLLATRNQTAAALEHLRKAIDIARLQGAALLELRAALILARHDLPEGRAALKA